MKNLVSNLRECKNIKEIVNIVPNDILIKVSYYSLSLWCLIPIFVLLTNIFVKETMVLYFLSGLYLLGFIGIINGIIYLYKNKLKLHKQIPFLLLIIFLVWTFISCLFAKNKVYSFIGTPYMYDGFLSYLCYAGFFLHGFIVSKNLKYIKKIFNCLLISSFILSYLVILDNSITDILVKNSNIFTYNLYASIFSNANHFGYYLTICTLVSCFLFILEKSKIGKLIYFESSSVLIYMLGQNSTLGSWLAVLIVLIISSIYFIFKKEKILSIIIILILFVGSIFTTEDIREDTKRMINDVININNHIDNLDSSIDNIIDYKPGYSQDIVACSGNGRLDLWINGIKFMKNKPLFGYGLENLGDVYSKVSICDKNTSRPHNVFIQIGASTGLIGLIIYVISIFIIYLKGIKISKKLENLILCCFFTTLGYLISAFFGNSIFCVSPYYLFLLGIISSVCVNNKNNVEIST